MFQILNFKKFSDGRGDLIPIELGSKFLKSEIPFDVKRIYFISSPTNKDNAVRGKHAHIDLEQVIICANGFFTLDLEDLNGEKKSIIFNENNKGIYIKKLIWRELRNFSKDCVIIVLASKSYDDQNYIRDYDEFKKLSIKLLENKITPE